MDISEIIKKGFNYPTNNWQNVVILGIIFLLISFFNGLGMFVHNSALSFVGSIISLILLIFVAGLSIDVIKEGINQGSNIPLLRADNFVGGLKAIVVNIVYYIIPAIIVLIVAFITGIPQKLTQIISSINIQAIQSGNVTQELINQTVGAIAPSVSGLLSSLAITLIVAFILFVIFSILCTVGFGRLAETGSLGEAISLGNVFRKTGEIGWLKIFGFFIITVIIYAIFRFISIILLFIPVIGIFLSLIVFSLFLVPFFFLFSAYAVGLLYNTEI